MLSLFDAILRRPMQEVIEHIDLKEDIRSALLKPGQTGDAIATMYSIITSYEAGSWEAVDDFARQLGLSRKALFTAYTDSVRWAEDMGAL